MCPCVFVLSGVWWKTPQYPCGTAWCATSSGLRNVSATSTSHVANVWPTGLCTKDMNRCVYVWLLMSGCAKWEVKQKGASFFVCSYINYKPCVFSSTPCFAFLTEIKTVLSCCCTLEPNKFLKHTQGDWVFNLWLKKRGSSQVLIWCQF